VIALAVLVAGVRALRRRPGRHPVSSPEGQHSARPADADLTAV
jgi:hypothetical protein